MRDDSRRKHRNQMSPGEIAYIEAFVHGLPIGNLYTYHAKRRMFQKKIKPEQLIDAVKLGYVVEMNNIDPADIRAVMRYDYTLHSVTVVVSIVKKLVITAWENAADDHHYTLDLSKYKWNVEFKTA